MQQLGGKIGFGFGEYVEIRAVYLQSRLKTSFLILELLDTKHNFNHKILL
jgi:hypothetical protein